MTDEHYKQLQGTVAIGPFSCAWTLARTSPSAMTLKRCHFSLWGTPFVPATLDMVPCINCLSSSFELPKDPRHSPTPPRQVEKHRRRAIASDVPSSDDLARPRTTCNRTPLSPRGGNDIVNDPPGRLWKNGPPSVAAR